MRASIHLFSVCFSYVSIFVCLCDIDKKILLVYSFIFSFQYECANEKRIIQRKTQQRVVFQKFEFKLVPILRSPVLSLHSQSSLFCIIFFFFSSSSSITIIIAI